MPPSKPSFSEPIELDGRTLEGGGQLIRIALCLSALTTMPVRITSIRGNRSGGGGLKAQHLACVKWLAHACDAYVEGAEKGSKELLFRPGEKRLGELSPAFEKKRREGGEEVYECKLEIGTAGSTGLALQAVLPFILFSKFPERLPVHLTLSGGTNVSGSPSYEYITQVLLPTLSNIGLPRIKPTLTKRGWSTGGSSIGSFTLEIPPRPRITLPEFNYTPSPSSPSPAQPTLKAIFIAPSSTHSHLRTVLPPAITHHFGATDIEIFTEPSLSERRLYLLLTATSPTTGHILATDHLYQKKIRSLDRATTEMAELVAATLATEVLSGACVDEHMRDQLVIFQALAHGKCEVYAGSEEDGEGEVREPSLHARTAEWVARRMLGVRFDSEGVCEGVGFGRLDDDEEEEERSLAEGVEDVKLEE